jgi:putative salt-induced outer membrane protein YdiY
VYADPRLFLLLATLSLPPAPAPAAHPAVPWDAKIGFSYLATSGNSETASTGFDTGFNRTGKVWSSEGSASGVSVTRKRRRTAESYNAMGRLKRRLRKGLQLTVGVRWERNRFAGIDSRQAADVSLLWEIHETPVWKLRALGGLSLGREEPRGDRPAVDSFGGLLQVSGDMKLSETAVWDGQVTFFPNFEDTEDYRVNGHFGVQAALNRHLGLRLGYDVKLDNQPVRGFGRTDTATTASLVVQLGRK